MELTHRQKVIFKTIVEQFICQAEPIGSKTLLTILEIPVSSATIRNEMALLEKAGLLEKTHTSSGRIPSQLGYRYYVEHLMETSLDPQMETSLKQLFCQRQCSLEDAVSTCCSILSEMTHLTSVVLGPETSSQTLQHIQLIPISQRQAVAIFITSSGHTENRTFNFEEDVSLTDLKNCTDFLNSQLSGVPIDQVVDELRKAEPLMAAKIVRHEVLFEAFVSAFMGFAAKKTAVFGRANMLAQPEFTDIGRLREMMRILEDGSMFKEWTGQESNAVVPLGSRNELIQIGDCSVITANLNVKGKPQGQLMVVGPNRMPYAKVIAMMEYISDVIEGLFESRNEGGSEDGQET